MKCPTCEVRMIRTEPPGAEALLCPECCGEWRPGRRAHPLRRHENPAPGDPRRVPEPRWARRGAGAGGGEDVSDWF